MQLQTSLARRLRDPIRRVLRNTPLENTARALYHAFVRRGVPVRIGGETLRFERGTEPPLSEPARTMYVEYADWMMMRAFEDAIRPGACVADVGAFTGTYSVIAAALVGEAGHVVAFEPSARNRERMMANVALNSFRSRVTLRPEAVSDAVGVLEFFSEADVSSSQNSLLHDALPVATRTAARVHVEQVRTIDLDSCFAALGRTPSVVKVDVEGAELAVLRGAQRILASGAEFLCELHPTLWPSAGHSAEDFLGWLRERGRTVIDLRTGTRAGAALAYGPYRLAIEH